MGDAPPSEQPLFSWGIIADAQYGDLDIGDLEGRLQRFREVPAKLQAALSEFRGRQPPLAFVAHLGDIINGNATEQATEADFNLIMGIFEGLGPSLPAYHVLGNHCLSVPRPTATKQQGIPESGYYSAGLPHGWRFIGLDTTEMSGHSCYPEGSEQWREARAYEQAHPMSEKEPQMSPWNGGVTRRQLQWLQQQLKEADAANERVIIASHHQIGPGACRATHAAWNYKEILEVLLASPSVALAVAGHDHEGGYACVGGKHFITLEAMVEAPQDSNAYGLVHVFPDRIEVEGRGTVTSRVLPL